MREVLLQLLIADGTAVSTYRWDPAASGWNIVRQTPIPGEIVRRRFIVLGQPIFEQPTGAPYPPSSSFTNLAHGRVTVRELLVYLTHKCGLEVRLP